MRRLSAWPVRRRSRVRFLHEQGYTHSTTVTPSSVLPGWAVAHALEAVGVVALFAAFDTLLGRSIEPGFYLFLFALWFTLSLVRYVWYARHSRLHRRLASQSVGALWWTSDTTRSSSFCSPLRSTK